MGDEEAVDVSGPSAGSLANLMNRKSVDSLARVTPGGDPRTTLHVCVRACRCGGMARLDADVRTADDTPGKNVIEELAASPDMVRKARRACCV